MDKGRAEVARPERAPARSAFASLMATGGRDDDAETEPKLEIGDASPEDDLFADEEFPIRDPIVSTEELEVEYEGSDVLPLALDDPYAGPVPVMGSAAASASGSEEVNFGPIHAPARRRRQDEY